VLVNHRGVVISASRQVRDQVRVGEGVGIDRLQVAVRLHGSGLQRFLPVAKLRSPELLLEDLLRTRKALRDLLLGYRQHCPIREAIDVRGHHRVEQHPVVLGELPKTTLERLGMHLGPVARHRTGKVHRIDRPRPRAGGLEAKVTR